LRVLPTVGFPVVQFTSVQQLFMAIGIVPKAGDPGLAKLPSDL